MLTNFFEIVFPADEISIQRLPYSVEQLTELRKKHNRVCSFFKSGDWIYGSPAIGHPLVFGTASKLSVNRDELTIQSLLRHMVFRTFRTELPERIPLDFAPLRFLARPEPNFEMPEAVRDEVGFFRVVEVYVKSISNGGSIRYGLVISSRRKWHLSTSLEEIVRNGYNPIGMAVIESVPIEGLEGVLAPDDSLIGTVESVASDTATVKSNSGLVEKPLSKLFLQRTPFQIGEFLKFRLGEQGAWTAMDRVYRAHHETLQPDRYFEDIKKYGEWFTKQEYRNEDGLSFEIRSNDSVETPSFALEQTRLVFGYTPGSSASTPSQGLAKFGPCDSTRFDKKSPHFLLVYHERNRGAATQFVGRLIDGIPQSGYFEKGFKNLYLLHDVSIEHAPIRASFAEDYEEAIDKAVRDSTKNFDLAIVDCQDDSQDIPESMNPYLRAKARLMAHGIPMQGIKTTHLRGNEYNHKFSLGPTALQMYAKMGGIPWVLPASQSVDHELVVGIESTIRRENYWAGVEQSRIVGITTFFLGDGTYVLGQEVKTVPYEGYLTELVSSLVKSLKEVADTYWKKGRQVRIVFHVFKPLKGIEIDAVSKVVKEFPEYNITFAFVTISQDHPWLLFQDAKRRFIRNGCVQVLQGRVKCEGWKPLF